MAGSNSAQKPDASTSGYLPNLIVVPGMLMMGAGAAAMILPIILFLGVMVPSLLLTGTLAVTLVSMIVAPLSKIGPARGMIMCGAVAAIGIYDRFKSLGSA